MIERESFTTERFTEYGYTNIGNSIFKQDGLSAKCAGLFCYLMYLPSGWQVYISQLCKHFSEGETSIKSGLKELRDAGYIRVSQQKDAQGRWLPNKYTLVEYPDVCKQPTEIPCPANTDVETRPPVERLPGQRLAANPSLINTKQTNTKIQNTKNTVTRREIIQKKSSTPKKQSKKDKFISDRSRLLGQFEFTEAIEEKIAEYFDYLADSNYLYPEATIYKQLELLYSKPDSQKIQMIDAAITHGWKSIYEPNNRASSFDTAKNSQNQFKTNEEKRAPLVGEIF